jgi:hypothetical protein
MTKPYRPSNGSEGMIFEGRWCDRCAKDDPEEGCGIMLRAMLHEIHEPEYPREWVQGSKGENPHCTAFSGDLPGSAGDDD